MNHLLLMSVRSVPCLCLSVCLCLSLSVILLTNTPIALFSSSLSASLTDLETQLKSNRGVPSYGVGIGSSTRTRTDRIGLTRPSGVEEEIPVRILVGDREEEEDKASHTNHRLAIPNPILPLAPSLGVYDGDDDVIPEDIMRSILEDDRLAELEAKQLMEAMNLSKSLNVKASEDDEEEDEDEDEEDEKGMLKIGTRKNPYDLRGLLENSSSSSSSASSSEASLSLALHKDSNQKGKEEEEDDEDSLLAHILKVSLDEAQQEATQNNNSKKLSSQETKPISRRPSGGGGSAAATAADPPLPHRTLTGSKQSILTSSRDEKPRHVNQLSVQKISELSVGPGGGGRVKKPTRQAPTAPTLASTPRASSSPRSAPTTASYSSATQSSRSKQSPRDSRDHPQWQQHQSLTHQISPRSTQRETLGRDVSSTSTSSSSSRPAVVSRTSIDRIGSQRITYDRSAAATAFVTPGRPRSGSGTRRTTGMSSSSSHQSDDHMSLPEHIDNELLDRAIALSLAESEMKTTAVPPAATATRPRSSSASTSQRRNPSSSSSLSSVSTRLEGYRGGSVRGEGVGRRGSGNGFQQRDPYDRYESAVGRATHPHRIEYLDDDEELDRAIAASLRDT
jgi:hypothetical protein